MWAMFRGLQGLQRGSGHSIRYMSSQARKKFYKNTSVVSAGGGRYEVTLDGKKMKTPNGNGFYVDNEPLALAVAHEWQSQKDTVLQSQMHLTGLCNVCIDNPTNATKYDLVDSVLNYLDTDTILFYSNEPEGLMAKQEQEWGPLIDWFCHRYEVDISPSKSFTPPVISPQTREKIRRHLLSYNFEAVQGITFGVVSLKSMLLMAATVERRLTTNEAVKLGRLEVLFQTERWGNVEWAHDIELHDTTARVSAASLFVHCNLSQYLTKTKD